MQNRHAGEGARSLLVLCVRVKEWVGPVNGRVSVGQSCMHAFAKRIGARMGVSGVDAAQNWVEN